MSFPKGLVVFGFCLALSIASCQSIIAQGRPENPGPPAAGLLANRTVDFSQAYALPFEESNMTLFENVIVDGRPYALVMGWGANILKPLQLEPLKIAKIPFIQPADFPIVIDGDATDWAMFPPVVVDPAGDKVSEYANQSGTDLADLYLVKSSEGNSNYLYFLMTLHDGGPIENCSYIFEFQQHLTQLHTPGDTLVVAGSPTGGQWAMSVGERTAHNFGNRSWDSPTNSVYVAVGEGVIEGKIPMWTVNNQPDTPLPYYPAVDNPFFYRTIQNHFLRVYIHPEGGNVADGNQELERPIVRH